MISIHAPREGCDGNMVKYCYRWQSFQSTHPVRGATRDHNRHERSRMISIHAPREGCDAFRELDKGVKDISIHAPREGCDRKEAERRRSDIEFQSTHPVRGATL